MFHFDAHVLIVEIAFADPIFYGLDSVTDILPIKGCFATRVVVTRNAQEARRRAIKSVSKSLQLLLGTDYLPRHVAKIESQHIASILAIFSKSTRGFSFY